MSQNLKFSPFCARFRQLCSNPRYLRLSPAISKCFYSISGLQNGNWLGKSDECECFSTLLFGDRLEVTARGWWLFGLWDEFVINQIALEALIRWNFASWSYLMILSYSLCRDVIYGVHLSENTFFDYQRRRLRGGRSFHPVDKSRLQEKIIKSNEIRQLLTRTKSHSLQRRVVSNGLVKIGRLWTRFGRPREGLKIFFEFVYVQHN